MNHLYGQTRILTAALLIASFLTFTTPRTVAADGDLDLTFDSDGKVTTNLSAAHDEAYGVAIQPDGKIVVVGSQGNSNGVIAVCRYNPDGSLDTSFDGDGKATTADVTSVSASGRAVALQSDGKIVVAGIGGPVGQFDFDFVLARFNANGSLDTTFNSDGVLTTGIETGNDEGANAVAIQPDGKIIAAGFTIATLGGTGAFALARFETNGTLDASFDGDGRVVTTFAAGGADAKAVMLQSDGRIVAAGSRNLARYLANGTLDGTFGTGGRVLVNANSISIEAAALQSDGKIVFAGAGLPAGGFNVDFAVGRIDAAGFLDPTFDTDGRNFIDLGHNQDRVYSIALRPDGKIILAGGSGIADDAAFGLARFNANGTIDTTFSEDGIVKTDFPNGSDVANDVAIQADGKIVAAGRTGINATGEFAVARYQSSGSSVVPPPVSFDFDGDRKTDIGIFRPVSNASEWWINRSGNGQTFALQFGAATDKITPADFTGDAKTDIAFFRPASGEWYVLRSEDFSFFALPFGANGDIPVPADYDGDRKADFAVYRPSSSNWFISQSSGAPTRIEQFGAAGDVPVVADYDGDAKTDVAIFRAAAGGAEWWINRSTAGSLALQFGASTDKAVQGDYTGDGKADIAIWRPSDANWLILRSEDFSFFGFPFGANGDVPSSGDYDGDGKFDPTVFRPSSATWFIGRTTAGTQIVQFGATGDRPIPNAYVP